MRDWCACCAPASQNTALNVGKRGYAFNRLQNMLLPTTFQAPKDTTLGKGASSFS